jgi:hypothetical protein
MTKKKTYHIQIEVSESTWRRFKKDAFNINDKKKISRKLFLGEILESSYQDGIIDGILARPYVQKEL